MKLFNLTYEDQNYVSSIPPSNLPENNYSLVEIFYSNNKRIDSIKGIYVDLEGKEKECILSDLDITEYVNKLNSFLKEENIDKDRAFSIEKDKLHLNFVEIIEDEDERIFKIFIILVSSYLIYFSFLEFPFSISLDLLSNKMFSYFTSFNPINLNEKSFIKQVSLLHRYFSTIFPSEINEMDKQEEEITKIVLAHMNKELDQIAKEIKEFKRKLLSDVKNFKKEIIEKTKIEQT